MAITDKNYRYLTHTEKSGSNKIGSDRIFPIDSMRLIRLGRITNKSDGIEFDRVGNAIDRIRPYRIKSNHYCIGPCQIESFYSDMILCDPNKSDLI